MKLGYSLCPNDTFIFYALVHGKVPVPGPLVEVLEDVETLNRWAFEGRLELTKISYAAYGHLREGYVALRAGGALGRGVGPLVVARGPVELAGARIAHPGRYTTAFLLLSLLLGEGAFEPVELRYDRIMPAVAAGEVDAGLIIHESRFTYPDHGLVKLLDLGVWWEEETGLPLPLGAILARRDLGDAVIQGVNEAVRASLTYAYAHPEEPRDYIRRYADELSDEVTDAHIRTYVNDFSLDVGEEGEAAVRELFARAEARGLVPPNPNPLFCC
ncbi:MAG TPA: 1,4-dihydroxy-6-naphthoate synthase [Oceanithermus profundus]|uniref:1,4-dihydroxy-6-naphtoate synthase n=1 Tax=Oceanithermus profundus TaxID=187137 RepID=A0A7C4Z5R6_9DEIN|nr:1,4-dihydroxy-6-naphthoate synthase [Oceanithermus profundus]